MLPVRNLKDLGAIIRERRRHLGLDQQTLAERVGVSRQWIVAAEQGKPRAPVGLVLQTLDALGLNVMVEERRAKVADHGSPADIDAIVRRARKSPG